MLETVIWQGHSLISTLNTWDWGQNPFFCVIKTYWPDLLTLVSEWSRPCFQRYVVSGNGSSPIFLTESSLQNSMVRISGLSLFLKFTSKRPSCLQYPY